VAQACGPGTGHRGHTQSSGDQMKIRALSAQVIRELAPYRELIPLMANTLAAVSRGEAELPLRWGLTLPGERGALVMMPGYLGPPDRAGIKLVSLDPNASAAGRPTHLGLVILYDGEGLVPLAILCGATVTALRTAAATACATNLLARPDARVLAILGSGEQADAHLSALTQVRNFSQIRIWSRNPAHSERLAQKHAQVEVHDTVESAVANADVICTLTSSRTPVLPGRLVAPGTHVNLVGSSSRVAAETDDELVTRSRFFVDFRASAMAQAGELLNAIERKRVTADHVVAELGDIVDGRNPGRTDRDEITVFKSLGIAAEDISLAAHVYSKAEAASVGTPFEI
jgi:ornithine cyclodeaminase/alanine dehydrogenase-like protein (mu-crystallin family)